MLYLLLMSAFMVSIIFSIGASAWVYNQAQRRSGGLTQQSLKVAGISLMVIFIIFFPIAMMLLG